MAQASGISVSSRWVTVTKTPPGRLADQAPGLEIRRGLDADIPALITLSKRTLRACYTPFLGKQSVQAWITSTLDDYVRKHVEGAWLATHGGAVCGYCVVKGPLLDLLLVDVRKHGSGIGTRLLEHAEQFLFSDPRRDPPGELRGQHSRQHLLLEARVDRR